MSEAVLKDVEKSAARMEGCDPLWLKRRKSPTFSVVEKGDEQRSPHAPDLILLHGLFGALSNWESTFPLFGHYSNPIALSFPILSGHRSEVKVKALAAYTEFFVRARSLAPVTLCGNSLGGHVAMRLCLASPELVDCLVLSATSGLYEHSVDSLPIRPDERFVREHMARVFYNSEFITDDAVGEIATILKSRMNVLNLIHAARSAKKDNLLHLLPEIKVPVLLLWGEDDQVTTMEVAEAFAKHLPNAELQTIKNCGHAPMIEHPEWFSEHVERFLRKHSRFYKSERNAGGEQ